MNNFDYDVVIIGGGSAGLAAAVSCYDNGVENIVILEKSSALGGILLQCIHAGFGLETFQEELTGPEYAEKFVKEVQARGIEAKLDATVLLFEKYHEGLRVTYSSAKDGYRKITCKSIVLALGCNERTRGQIATPGDRCSGVMTAGVAQKYMNIDGLNIGKNVFILGSGDIGLIMARRMKLEGANVLGVAEIMPYSNGLNRNIVQCLEDYNIPLYLHHTVKDIIGKTRLEKIVLAEVDDKLKAIPGTEREIECDTLLLSVGLVPSVTLLENAGIKIDPKTKSAIVNDYLETSIPGVFACGNGLHVHDLVDYVSKESTNAGRFSAMYVQGKLSDSETVDVINGNLVGYCLPQMIHKQPVTIYFRVRRPMKDCYLVARQGDNILKRVKKMYLIPSEMDNIKIDGSQLLTNDPVEIYVEEN